MRTQLKATVKKRWHHIMVKCGVPKPLWDYGRVWATETCILTINGSVSSHGQPPEQLITGEVPEILPYLEFDFYDWVEYRENTYHTCMVNLCYVILDFIQTWECDVSHFSC